MEIKKKRLLKWNNDSHYTLVSAAMAQYGTWKWSGRSSRGWCVCVCLCVVLCCALCIKCTTKDLSDEPVFSKLRSHLIDVYGARQRQTVLSQMHHKMIEKMKWKPTTIPNVLGKIILLIWLYIKWTACNFCFSFLLHTFRQVPLAFRTP